MRKLSFMEACWNLNRNVTLKKTSSRLFKHCKRDLKRPNYPLFSSFFFTAFFVFSVVLSEEERIEGQVFCFSFYGFFCIYLFEKGETHWRPRVTSPHQLPNDRSHSILRTKTNTKTKVTKCVCLGVLLDEVFKP